MEEEVSAAVRRALANAVTDLPTERRRTGFWVVAGRLIFIFEFRMHGGWTGAGPA